MIYWLVNSEFASESGPVKIVDLPIKNGDFPYLSYLCSVVKMAIKIICGFWSFLALGLPVGKCIHAGVM